MPTPEQERKAAAAKRTKKRVTRTRAARKAVATFLGYFAASESPVSYLTPLFGFIIGKVYGMVTFPLFPFRFVMYTRRAAKLGGGWDVRDFTSTT